MERIMQQAEWNKSGYIKPSKILAGIARAHKTQEDVIV